MKICFSGVHRTGKTTLAERIALENNFIMYHTKVEKTFIKKSPKEFENLFGKNGFEKRLEQQNKIFKHIVDCIAKGENFSVYDRSPLDVYCYSEYFLSKHLKQFEAQKEDIKRFNNHLAEIRNKFDIFDFVFLVQPGIRFENSEKSCSEDIVNELNEVFLNAIDLFLPKYKYFLLPKNVIDLEERTKICQNVLKQKIEH